MTVNPSPAKMVSFLSRVSQPRCLYFNFSVYCRLKHPLKKRSIGENTILELLGGNFTPPKGVPNHSDHKIILDGGAATKQGCVVTQEGCVCISLDE